MAKKGSKRLFGPLEMVKRHPNDAFWLMISGAVVGLFVAKAVPAVRSAFGLSGYVSVQRFRCPKTGRLITRDNCGGCPDQGSCPLYLRRVQG